VAWWLGFSPLRVLWAGTDAVIVFFVLSGLVLALPWVSGRPPSWRSYYGKRIVRLYLPVVAAVGLAVVLIASVDRTADRPVSFWLAMFHPSTVHPGQVLDDLALIRGANFTNTALWSLQWEVVFSITLPLWIGLARRADTRLRPFVVATIAAIALGASMTSRTGHALMYLPMFVLGVLMAFHRTQVAAGGARLRRAVGRHDALVVLGAATALVVLPKLNEAFGVLVDPVAPAITVVQVLAVVLAAVLLVAAAWTTPAVVAWLERPTCQWLGSRSYALYLVHEPIVVAVAFAVGGRPSPAVLLFAALPAALVTAEVFYRTVERPSIALASACGRAAGRPRTRDAERPAHRAGRSR